jgi:hypothetical protein
MSIPTSNLAKPGGIYNVASLCMVTIFPRMATRSRSFSFVTTVRLGVKKRIKPDTYAIKLPAMLHWTGLAFRRRE